jgi:ubiquinone/menaquinone biosynthesis C-methylase UbiE
MAKPTTIPEHYNKIAEKRSKWLKRNKYYHRYILNHYKKIIPAQSSILELGCGTGNLIGKLDPFKGVGVDISSEMLKVARNEYQEIEFIHSDAEKINLGDIIFEYIIISGTLGNIQNIQSFLSNIRKYTNHDTRVIIDFYNPLWNPIIRLGQKTGVKMPELFKNWLSIDDIENFLYTSGYQTIKRDYILFFPKFIPIISFILNHFIGRLPILRRFCINHLVVARPFVSPGDSEKLSATVVITCRDEEGNIQGLVERLPKMGTNTEIIFVEGHSKDNTVDRINEMILKYPEKDIKLLTQKGIGQGDAFRYGFDEANGDLVMWLEADLTTPPEEASLFWETFISGRGEYLNGSRFIYKMQKSSMPLINFLGNRFFGILFTLLLKQRFTDTLCGFKAISKRNYLKIREQIDYFGDFDPFGDFELIFGAIKNNLKVAEIPVHYQPRAYGESKAYGQSFFSFLKHGWLLLRMSWKAFVKFTISL